MTDSVNINDDLYKSSSAAGEFNKVPARVMVTFHEEITVMKTEVKEEIYDFEMSIDEMKSMNAKEERTFSSEIVFKEESLEPVTNTEQSLNENLVVGKCENKEANFQNYICQSEFGEEIFLKSHYEQCFNPAKKILPESKGAGETYECMHCTYLTSVRESAVSNGDFTKHELMKHSAKPKKYSCKDCKYDTEYKTHLTRHIRIHTNDKPFKCTYKNCKCTLGQAEFCKCSTCLCTFRNSCNLKKHILTKHSGEPKKYKCSNCNFATHTKTSLVIHNRVHTGEKPFKCTFKNCKCSPGQEEFCDCNTCEYASTSNCSLKHHILTKHSVEPKKYKCGNCMYATHRKTNLVIHNRIHTGEKVFKCMYKNCKCNPEGEHFSECNTCEFAFTTNRGLKQHILLKHSIEPKKYKCSNCKYATYIKAQLVTHNHIHSGDKSYKCTYKNCKCTPGQEEFCECNTCGFASTNSGHLKHHILTKHSAEPKKYKCRNCKYATHIKGSLMTHNRIHTGEKSFKCTYRNCKCSPGQDAFCECNTCEFASATNSNLKQHILLKHSMEPKKYKCSKCNYATHVKASLVIHNRIHIGE